MSTAHSPSKSIATTIEKRLLRSTSIFESFGNAKTSQCPNSSRFVKYTKVYVDCDASTLCRERGSITKASIDTFLLDKSRVTSLSGNRDVGLVSEGVVEWNYNIFYEVVAAWADICKQVRGNVDIRPDDLSWCLQYRLITAKDSTLRKVSQADWKKRFSVTDDSLAAMGCDDITTNSIWGVLAGIILLGEVDFIELDSFDGALAQLDDQSVNICYTFCRILGIENLLLVEMLTQRVMVARGESFVMAMSRLEAQKARDAVCRALYSHIFSCVVNIINQALSDNNVETPSCSPYIGILDMFGMEQTSVNGLEQLFINYSNEVLQNEFNKHIFESQVELLRKESVECPLELSECPSNSLCVDMICCPHASGKTIFSILETIGRCPKPVDAKFCWELHKAFDEDGNSDSNHHHSFDRYFPAPHHKDKRNTFIVRHFMGNVQYTVGAGSQWVLGNIDPIPEGLVELMQSSDLKFLNSFSASISDVSGRGDKGRREGISRRPSLIAPSTLSSNVAVSMQSLVDSIKSTERSYILCIRPNETPGRGVFSHKYVLRQIRAMNCVKACEIMKIGLYERISFQDVKALWSDMLSELSDLCQGEDDGTIISLMLQSLGLPCQTYKLGKSMVFLERGGLLRLRSVSVKSPGEVSELILRFQKTLLGKRECQSCVQDLAVHVSKIESMVTEGKLELNSIQSQITTSTSSQDGSGSSIALSIALNDMHSSADSLSCLLAVAETKIRTLLPVAIEFKKDEVSSLADKLAGEKGVRDALLIDIKRIEDSCSSRLSSRLQEGALERWQSITKIDELMQGVRVCMSDADLSASRCQLDLAREVIRKCRNLMASTEHTLKKALMSARDAIGQVDVAKSEQNALIRDIEQITNRSEMLVESINTLIVKCDALEKRRIGINGSGVKAKDSRSSFPLASESTNSTRDMRRAGSMRLTREESAKLMQEGTSVMRSESDGSWRLQRGGVNVDSDSDDDFAPIVVDMWIVPEGWEEVFDIPTQLPYYYNTITQMSQWERPTSPAQSVGGQMMVAGVDELSSQSSAPSPVTTMPHRTHRRIQNSTIEVTLAEMQMADLETAPSKPKTIHKKTKKSGTVSFSLGQSESVYALDDVIDPNSVPVDDLVHTSTTTGEASGSVGTDLTAESSHGSSRTVLQSHSNHSTSVMPKRMQKCNLSYGRITTSQLDRMGIELKRGFLLAKEGFLSRWKKRYFVLEGPRLSCYKSIDHYYSGAAVSRTMTLSKRSVTAYTDARFTFSVKTPNIIAGGSKSGRQDEWQLVAESEESMRQWVAYINAHIHYLHRSTDVSVYDYNVLTSDRYWLEGVVETCYWRLPLLDSEGAKVNPLPVLSLPNASAPRTGEAILPGEYLEVAQIIDVDGHLFLRLADDRGWVKVWHPNNIGNLLIRARECVFVEVKYRAVVGDDQV